MSASVYVSGLPGIGKTSAVKHLARSRPDEFVRMSFGEALRDVMTPDATVESFRRKTSAGVNRTAIERATAVLGQRIQGAEQVVLIDSHAVTPTPDGLRATPDTRERVAAFGYSLITHLSAASVEERVLRNSGREGRTEMSMADLTAAET